MNETMNNNDEMQDRIEKNLENVITDIECPQAISHHHGKIRESFVLPDNRRAIVVTDRISAFDSVLGTIPFKGQVLNQTALWWFKKLDEINIPHHIIDSPDPNISVVKNVTPLPIEVIVRGYLTGSTQTSSWNAYQNHDRMICGLEMPEGMKKNEKFPHYLVTPTTKPETGHDENISREEVISRKYVSEENYKKAEEYALKMFALGQKEAEKRGLILVDTKYEMGLTEDGELLVIDEVHTPDSSRYWVTDEYYEDGKEFHTKSLDKEFVRQKLVDKGYNKDGEQNPKDFLDDEIRIEASKRYIELYEKMTGEAFVFSNETDGKTRTQQIETVLKNL